MDGEDRLRTGQLVVLATWSLAGLVSAADLERARELYQRTEHRASLELLLAAASPDASALALTGKNYFMLGDFKRAGEYLEKAVAAEPRSADHRHWLGKAFGRRAETSSFVTAPRYAVRCRQAFEQAVELDPRNLEAINDLFEYYLEAPGLLGGGVGKAEGLGRRIAELDPVEHQYALARIAEKNKHPQTAERHYRQAIEMAPRQIGRWLDLAKFLARQGRHQESDSAFLQAERIEPNNRQWLFARASVSIETKRNPDAARQWLRRYLESPLTPEDPPRWEAEKLLRQVSGGSTSP